MVVIGGGTMGGLNALVAKQKGARVIVSELMEKKIRVAEQLGLEVIDGSKVDPVEEARARTAGRGADTVILAVAASAAI